MKRAKPATEGQSIIGRTLLGLGIGALALSAIFVFTARAFTGPSGTAGAGVGAISSDSQNNIGVGTSSTSGTTKVFVVASSTSASSYAFRVVQPNSTDIFSVRNDGLVSISGTLSAGSQTGTISSANVSSGAFGANTGGGNYTFPGNILLANGATRTIGIPLVGGTTPVGNKVIVQAASATTIDYNTGDISGGGLDLLAGSTNYNSLVGGVVAGTAGSATLQAGDANTAGSSGIYALTAGTVTIRGGNVGGVGGNATKTAGNVYIYGGTVTGGGSNNTNGNVALAYTGSGAQGSVGIGTASPSYQLQLSTDSAGKPNGGSWSNSSDERLKTNIVPVSGALDKITQLNPVLFDWRNPSLHGNAAASGGFIAQDIQKVFPDFVAQVPCQGADCALVGGAGSKTYSLTLPFKFDAYLVGSITELNAKVDAQQKEIDDLKTAVKALQNGQPVPEGSVDAVSAAPAPESAGHKGILQSLKDFLVSFASLPHQALAALR